MTGKATFTPKGGQPIDLGTVVDVTFPNLSQAFEDYRITIMKMREATDLLGMAIVRFEWSLGLTRRARFYRWLRQDTDFVPPSWLPFVRLMLWL
jgi:hypothetical protein